MAYRRVGYRRNVIRPRRPHCCRLKTDSSLLLTNVSECDHGDGLTPRDGPSFRCPRPHRRSEAYYFPVRVFVLVARAPAPFSGVGTGSFLLTRNLEIVLFPA